MRARESYTSLACFMQSWRVVGVHRMGMSSMLQQHLQTTEATRATTIVQGGESINGSSVHLHTHAQTHTAFKMACIWCGKISNGVTKESLKSKQSPKPFIPAKNKYIWFWSCWLILVQEKLNVTPPMGYNLAITIKSLKLVVMVTDVPHPSCKT